VYIVNEHTEIPKNEDCIFITRNGKMIRRNFSISGGSVGLFEGKRIGRAKNLEKLLVEIKSLTKRLDEIKDNLDDKQRELNNYKGSLKKADIEVLLNETRRINEEFISVKTKKEQYDQMLNSNTLKKGDIQEKIAELAESIEMIKPQVEKEKDALEELNYKINHLSTDLSGQNELLSIKLSAFNQENLIFHQQQNKVDSIEQEIGFKQSAFDSSRERIDRSQVELIKNEEEIKLLLERNENNEDELIGMYLEKESIEQAVNEAEKEYYQARGNIDEIEKELREFSHGRENIDTLLMELQNRLNELRLQLSGVKERLSVEFNVDIEEIMNLQDLEEIVETEIELKEKVFQARDRLEKIGPINPMAMEAYDEIKQRYDFIIEQKEDLIKAKESLLSTISEIDQVAKEAFLDSFYKIKANFIKVFWSLFTEEDDCDLKLTNPDDPLESSIDIIAKPKGKKPLTINQLSGGEKTLTAISLLFSIYLLKPAPFCIFDEVDAPLDDANIDKFNSIIKKFSTDSQFIIVTHNKRTMVAIDVIYGVTMVEQGVSRVVPVDLRELAE
jgi:chromosome segregation protein